MEMCLYILSKVSFVQMLVELEELLKVTKIINAGGIRGAARVPKFLSKSKVSDSEDGEFVTEVELSYFQ
ncbi:hypothetical protein JTE90_014097 [Oedothorax gibbosus]|uniref:Uncharacterized protein n=1 Tax=Oedothorax gibbosus TaxID=931172 RepID=A0AAV6V8P0_9ARAC|nr:hypothetical protein JTE90_014097 [Oedothorax gibbosus]